MKERNIAYIDGQNLHMGISDLGWKIDHKKFRKYLADEYRAEEAYYYFGYLNEDLNSLYTALQRAGFIVIFKEHSRTMLGEKKGNVDTGIVFDVMKKLIEDSDVFNRIVIVSGDGDYKKLVDFLYSKNRLERILFPNGKYASSLYNKLDNKMKLAINRIRPKIEYLT